MQLSCSSNAFSTFSRIIGSSASCLLTKLRQESLQPQRHSYWRVSHISQSCPSPPAYSNIIGTSPKAYAVASGAISILSVAG